jgi:hypothetical protein
MADSGNTYPLDDNEFDSLSPDDFLEPTPETRRTFEDMLDSLPFDGMRARIGEIQFTWQDDQPHLLRVGVEEHFDPRGDLTAAFINFIVQNNQDEIFVSPNKVAALTEQDRSVVEDAVNVVAANVSEVQGKWLRAAWQGLAEDDETFMPHAVSDLLSGSPYDVREFTDESCRIAKGKRSLRANRVTANQAELAYMTTNKRSVCDVIVQQDGKFYSYGRGADGTERLVIGDRQEHQSALAGSLDATAYAKSLGVRGDITEGKLKELIAAMQSVMSAEGEAGAS